MVSLKKNSRVGGKLIANVDESVQKSGDTVNGALLIANNDPDPLRVHRIGSSAENVAVEFFNESSDITRYLGTNSSGNLFFGLSKNMGDNDQIETVPGAQSKADSAESSAKGYAQNAVAQGSNSDPNTTQQSYILTDHANGPGDGYYHIQTYFYSDKTGNRAQIAIKYHSNDNSVHTRHKYSSSWTPWTKMEDISGSQSKADAAESAAKNASVSKSGDSISGKLTMTGTGEIMDVSGTSGDSLDGSDAWIRMGNATYAWQLLYQGSSSGTGGNEFMIKSTNTSNYLRFDHDGNFDMNGNEIWHAANDGSGSGLDADKVDGLQASQFVRSDADDTMNGSLTIQTSGGNLELGPKNSSYSHIYTDRPSFYFNKVLKRDGHTVWDGGNDGSGSGLDADLLDGNHANDFADANHNHDGRYLRSTGGIIDGGTNTVLTLKSDDSGESTLELHGNNQGSGRLYVGQDETYGGGILYNGDGSPDISGSGSDNITLYRRSSGTNYWTARNKHNSNNWTFRGNVAWNDGGDNLNNLRSDVDGKEDALSSNQKRTITSGASEPSGGSDGDIHLQYE